MIISRFLKAYRDLFKRGNAIRFGAEVKNTQLGRKINISRYCFVSNSKIADYTSIGRNTVIINAELGKFCSISWNVTIGATSHDYNRLSTHAFSYIKFYGFVNSDTRIKKQTSVGHDVWIGANAVIMPGVTIGNGAVVGAGSIVTKDVAPYDIVYGNPAGPRGSRFDEEKIRSIEEMAWWDWNDAQIKENIEIFKKPFE